MVAAQRFNAAKNRQFSTIYCSISNSTQWRFLKLEENVVTIDLMDYLLPPVGEILGIFLWTLKNS
ncbi:MAG: hypothetical protein RMY34_33980 [Aulosira sp. DedQUE10]|nr:hypothetical protein [Aulosira sp. DedQUE10]